MSFGQTVNKNRVSKFIETTKDTITLEKFAISPVGFRVKNSEGIPISDKDYKIDFQKATLFFPELRKKQVEVVYFKYPSFLTQVYSPFDKNIIVSKATPSVQTYSLKQELTKNSFFGGLYTNGNVTRGITVGNNQGSVLNSGLDLQLTGNLSKNLKIRASIKDSSLPIQENGVSQNINEFDRVFIELFTDTWNVKAGDVDLTNQDSYFLNFTKKINGAKLDVILDNEDQKTSITASGALARGRFNSQNITAQEGNQGPYQLFGINNELNIVMISASETVYVNGVVLKRGEQEDYVVDYNTAEITFNPTFPINSTHRIIVDFQYSDQNYNRFVTHDGVKYENEKFSIGGYFYSESDVKNQPIQQNLNDVQKASLANAGQNTALMVAPSAQKAEFDENRVQYVKNAQGNFEQSSDESKELYNVVFRFVGAGSGDYVLQENVATGNIFSYVGVGLGTHKAEIQLFAPTKTQVAVVNTSYKLKEASFLKAEVAYSNNDQNLFSSLDENQNQGWATTLAWEQQISKGVWESSNVLNADFVHRNFNNIEGLYNVEFNRDWNIDANSNPNALGSQSYITNAFSLSKNNKHAFLIQNDYLSLGNNFKGFKSGIITKNNFNKFTVKTTSSFLNSNALQNKSKFLRHETQIDYSFGKTWLEGLATYEDNKLEDKRTLVLDSLLSQKLAGVTLNVGVGDSTKVYSKFSVGFTEIDSVRIRKLQKVQAVKNIAVESQWLKTKNAFLHTFANYRNVNNTFAKNVDIVNARVQYTQSLFKNMMRLSTLYETSSGNTRRQNFTYIETEPGQGFYTYLGDLDNDGIKDFDEFEVAQFTDQANYLRVVLPNLNRILTQKAKINQSLFVGFERFKSRKEKWLKTLSHFSTQSSILVDKDREKVSRKIQINPFGSSDENVVGLRQNIISSIYFNRGLQKYSTAYSFQNSKNVQRLSVDTQTSNQKSHELNFQHNVSGSWLLGTSVVSQNATNTSSNENSTRNFKISGFKVNPSIQFLKNEYASIKTSYTYKKEENRWGEENLEGHNFGLAYNYNHLDKGSVLANINLIENTYDGSVNTPAAYRILEGLQPGTNYTWSLIIQKKLTALLDLSINYNGRKNTDSNAVHVGNVQLRANF